MKHNPAKVPMRAKLNFEAKYQKDCKCSGFNLLKYSSAEINRAKEAPFKPSVFGESLDFIMELQEKTHPELFIPQIVTFLTCWSLTNVSLPVTYPRCDRQGHLGCRRYLSRTLSMTSPGNYDPLQHSETLVAAQTLNVRKTRSPTRNESPETSTTSLPLRTSSPANLTSRTSNLISSLLAVEAWATTSTRLPSRPTS